MPAEFTLTNALEHIWRPTRIQLGVAKVLCKVPDRYAGSYILCSCSGSFMVLLVGLSLRSKFITQCPSWKLKAWTMLQPRRTSETFDFQEQSQTTTRATCSATPDGMFFVQRSRAETSSKLPTHGSRSVSYIISSKLLIGRQCVTSAKPQHCRNDLGLVCSKE